MAFKKFIRTKVQADEPVIGFGDNRFQYSAVFSKLAELDKFTHVEYFIDEEQRKISLKFHKDRNSKDCYTLSGKNNKYRSAAAELMKRLLWIDKVAKSKNSDERKFVATKHSGMWVIQLSPAFENSVLKNFASSDLPNESGIYRYINEEEEIVYIGKGNIKARYSQQERSDWVFSGVEFSIVNGDEEQYEWESYWIEKFREASNGLLPYYNKVSGHQK